MIEITEGRFINENKYSGKELRHDGLGDDGSLDGGRRSSSRGVLQYAPTWVLAILGIVFLIRWIVSESRGNLHGRETPMEVLKKRYARGEINKAQYEEMKKDIM